jgi:probable rRNA maturation factor
VSRVARPGLQLSLQFADPRHREALPRHKVARWVRAALEAPGQVTVRIVGEEEGRTLNREWRGKDYATNVLTFDYEHAPVVVADLVLCAAVVEREARRARKELSAHYAHLLVHGTLHAQGWDHETGEEDAQAMEARESALMLGLGLADPYRRTRRPPAAKR